MERSILKTPEDVQQWFVDCPDIVSFDFETTGLNYLKMEAVGISFCDGERSCYIDLWQDDKSSVTSTSGAKENENYEDVCREIKGALVCRLLIAHNFKFDYKCCIKFLDFVPDSIFCSYVAAYLLDENLSSHSLDNLAQYYFGTGKTAKWDSFTDYHSEDFYEYATVDAELAYRLYTLFSPRLVSDGLEHVFKIEMDFVPVAAEIEMTGILIDQQALSELQSTVELKLLECEDHLLKLVEKKANIQEGLFGQKFRVSPVNFNSTPQLVWCFQKLGLKLKEKTDKGAWSIGKSTLERLKGDEFIDTLTESKTLKKLYTGYILPCWEMIDEDGRIRPNVGIVKTGRTSMSNPNLQQLPNVKDQNINYRRIFSTTGLLVGADYSGQELIILAEESNDTEMKRCFAKGLNLHLRSATDCFDLPIDESEMLEGSASLSRLKKKYRVEYHRGKNGCNFPIVYGSSAAGVSYKQGVSKQEAQRWIDTFKRLYPDVQPFVDSTHREVYQEKQVRTMMGRLRRFPDYDSLPPYAAVHQPSKARCKRQGVNFKIQGFGADVAKIAGRRILDQFRCHPEWKAKIILIVHDEYVVEVLEEHPGQGARYVETVKQCVIGCMENAVSLSVQFRVDCKTGKSYDLIK